VTKGEAAELVLGKETWDAALPEDWVKWVARELVGKFDRHAICCGLVWAYDRHASLFGRPCALTVQANSVLQALNERQEALAKETGRREWQEFVLTPVPADRMPTGLKIIASSVCDLVFRGMMVEAQARVRVITEENAQAGLCLNSLVCYCLADSKGYLGEWVRAQDGDVP
jgi:hypothetical protein